MASADKQAARNRKILIAKARGEDVNAIAAQYDLSPTRVRQILAAGTVVLADAHTDPVQVALERRAQYEVLYEEAFGLYERIPDTNPSPKVGALRLAIGVLDRLSAWDQTVGVLPGNLSWIYAEIDMNWVADELISGLEAAGIPMETIREIALGIEARKRGHRMNALQEHATPLDADPPPRESISFALKLPESPRTSGGQPTGSERPALREPPAGKPG
jgi:hypothetical protein